MKDNGPPGLLNASKVPRENSGWERALPWLLTLLLLAAFCLRVYGLDRHSLSGDEIWSVLATQASWDDFWSTVPLEDHPPLYFLALRGWLSLAGESEHAVRFLSAAAGLVGVALVYALGRRLLTPFAAGVAALVTAFSTLLILSSQDAKGHMPAATLSVLSVYLTVRVLEDGGRRNWGAWTAVAAASLFTEYSTAIIVLFEVLVLSYAVWRGRRNLLSRAHWLGSHLLLGISVLGWALWARPAAAIYSGTLTPNQETVAWRASLTPVGDFLRYTAQGHIRTDTASNAVLLALCAAAGLGLWRLRRRPWTRAIMAAYLIVPVLALVAVTWGRQGFAPRHALAVAPAFYLVLAVGLTSLRRYYRGLAVAALLLVLLSNARGLHPYYWGEWYDPWYARDDFRSVAAYLDTNVRSDDTVMVAAPSGLPLLKYYATRQHRYGVLGSSANGEAAVADGSLEAVWDTASRLWLVSYQPWLYDPQQRVQAWLDVRGDVFDQASFPYINVRGYSTRAYVTLGRPLVQLTVGATLGDVAQLLGYDSDLSEVSTQGRLYVTLYWQALRKSGHSYSVFVHLLDADGNIVAQKDNRPVGDLLPTYMWEPDTYIRDEYRLDLPSAALDGSYRLIAGMYDQQSGQRLSIAETDSDSVDLGWIELPPTPRDARGQPAP